MKLGDKIKKARIEAKMTQKELADGKITRNMLSQIENGKATPSVSTLNHITDKLGLPGGYFSQTLMMKYLSKNHSTFQT